MTIENPPERVSQKLTITLEIPKGETVDEFLIRTITDNAQMDIDMYFVRKRMARHQDEIARQLVAGIKFNRNPQKGGNVP